MLQTVKQAAPVATSAMVRTPAGWCCRPDRSQPMPAPRQAAYTSRAVSASSVVSETGERAMASWSAVVVTAAEAAGVLLPAAYPAAVLLAAASMALADAGAKRVARQTTPNIRIQRFFLQSSTVCSSLFPTTSSSDVPGTTDTTDAVVVPCS